MQCSCIKEFDFDLIQTNCRDIIYVDRSLFQDGPGYSKSYTLNIKSHSVTKSYTVTAGVPLHLDLGGCVDPAVYTFYVDSCIDRFTKKAAITCTLECGWLKAVAKLGQGVDSKVIKELREDTDYIPLIANTDYKKAVSLTENVQRRLKQINCDCSCS